MYPYIVGWMLTAVAVAATVANRRSAHVLRYLMLIYFAGLAFLRGAVGTDTFSYEEAFHRVIAGNALWSGEGAFGALALLLIHLFGSVELGLRAVSVLTLACIGIYMARSGELGVWLIMGLLLPAFGFVYTMNIIRFGLAASLLLLVASYLPSSRPTMLAALALLLPSLVHVSAGLAALIVIAIAIPLRIVASASLVLLLVATYYFAPALGLQDYLFAKTDAYGVFAAPSDVSGVSRAIVIMITLVGVVSGGLTLKSKARVVAVGSVATAVAVYIAQHSYAGLRLLDVVAFALPLGIALEYRWSNTRFDVGMKLALVAAGCAGAIGVGRNFAMEAGVGQSPFVPYTTWLSD